MPVHGQTCLSETILLELPHLRAYARLMTNDQYQADREVEETLKRAMAIMDRLSNQCDLRIQLLTILRSFLIAGEPARKDLEARSGIYEKLNSPFHIGNGHGENPVSLLSALVLLDYEDREALVLTAGVRLSPLEAAKISGCEVGEHSARLCRGFARLAELFPELSTETTSTAEQPASEIRGADDDRGMVEAAQF
jgi:RNA polymerase sigma-70 factor, ECF subfamily